MVRFTLSHKMMSFCLLDSNFFAQCPGYEPIHEQAAREYEIRRARIEPGKAKGCKGCQKNKAAAALRELEKRHGGLFAKQTVKLADEKADLTCLKKYIRDHYASLTSQLPGTEPSFESLMLFVPRMNKDTGLIQAVELEI